jgi:hypothetical protein
LTVTGFLLMVLAASEFYDLDLIGTAMSLDGRGNLAAFHVRGAYINIVTIGNHQNLVDFDRRAFVGSQFLNATDFAFSNLILFTTCTDYSVHGVFSKSLTEKARILPAITARGKC